jgi:hypothetical protein
MMQTIARSLLGAVACLVLVIASGLGHETEFDELRLFPSVSGHDATLV